MRYFLSFFLIFLLTVSCKTENKSTFKQKSNTTTVKYAKGFDIVSNDSVKKIIVKKPYKNASETIDYILYSNNKATIKTPVEKLVVTSTTHIPMIELLGGENTLVGFPHTQYVSSEKTRKRIDTNAIKEIGKEGALNTEVLIDLQPDLVVGYGVNSIDKTYRTIEKAGIPVLMNGDWLEETPLGRAEWIKFFGVLLNKEQQADSIFKVIENNYLEAKKLAQKSDKKPTILSGAIMNKDVWNLPAGDSFVAQYLKDANLNYLWDDTTGKGSLNLSFESVLDKAQNADFWIAPGYFNTKEQLLQSNNNYQQFTAFKNDKIYTPNLKKGVTGGVIYFELAPTRPDLVLKDIIKITQPALLPNYELSFFEKMPESKNKESSILLENEIFPTDTIIKGYKIEFQQLTSSKFAKLEKEVISSEFEKDDATEYLTKKDSCYYLKLLNKEIDTMCSFNDGEYYENYSFKGFSKRNNLVLFDWNNWEEAHSILISLKDKKHWLLCPFKSLSPQKNHLLTFSNFIDVPIYESNEFFIYEFNKEYLRDIFYFSDQNYGVFEAEWIKPNEIIIHIKETDQDNFEFGKSFYFVIKITSLQSS